MRFFFIALLTLHFSGCATPVRKDQRFPQLWKRVSFSGKGKARLEVPPQSWVFSFEAEFEQKGWEAGILIPTQGEEVIRFPGLDQPRPLQLAGPGDFRYRVEQALREANQKNRWGHPSIGQDYVRALHHLLRWAYAEELRLDPDCREEKPDEWSCERDGFQSSWNWVVDKEEFIGVFALRPKWKMRVVFKNLTADKFARITLEMVREGEFRENVELRQEFFFR